MVAPQRNRTANGGANNNVITRQVGAEHDREGRGLIQRLVQSLHTLTMTHFLFKLLINLLAFVIFQYIFMVSSAPLWIAALTSIGGVLFSKYAPSDIAPDSTQSVGMACSIILAWTQTLACDSTQSLCLSHALRLSSTAMMLVLIHMVVSSFTKHQARIIVYNNGVAFIGAIAHGAFFCYRFPMLHPNEGIVLELYPQIAFALVMGLSISNLSHWTLKKAGVGHSDNMTTRTTLPLILWMIFILIGYNGWLHLFRYLHWHLFMAKYEVVVLALQ